VRVCGGGRCVFWGQRVSPAGPGRGGINALWCLFKRSPLRAMCVWVLKTGGGVAKRALDACGEEGGTEKVYVCVII